MNFHRNHYTIQVKYLGATYRKQARLRATVLSSHSSFAVGQAITEGYQHTTYEQLAQDLAQQVMEANEHNPYEFTVTDAGTIGGSGDCKVYVVHF